MKYQKLRLNKFAFVIVITVTCLIKVSIAQETTPTIQSPIKDSISTQRTNEVNFIINQIDSGYICGRRGLSDQEWDRRVKIVHAKVDSAYYNRDYLFALRYIGLLINDAHFDFPDGGSFNRFRIFQMTDTIFPIWVKTWTDGSVYVVKDYLNKLPKNTQIVSINGQSAKNMALLNLDLAPKEKLNALASINARHEPDPRTWYNFTNFIFMEGIKPPYKIEYIVHGNDKIDTITLQGITRGERFKEFKKSGDKKRTTILSGGDLLYGKVMDYKRIGKSSKAVWTINYFWGKNLFELFLFKKDWTFTRKLKATMARLNRQNIDTLIIDIRNNGGGKADNLYKTLNYFTDKQIDANNSYYITDNNRNIVKTVISNTPHEIVGLNEEQHHRMFSFIDSVKSNSLFHTDSLFDLKYTPDSTLKHRYKGKVYILTGNYTFSAAQQFAQIVTNLNIGHTAGQRCGGYSSVTGGNGSYVKLPKTSWFTFMVPYSKQREVAPKYAYDTVDIPIKITFDEWLNDKDLTLNKLLDRISNRN